MRADTSKEVRDDSIQAAASNSAGSAYVELPNAQSIRVAILASASDCPGGLSGDAIADKGNPNRSSADGF